MKRTRILASLPALAALLICGCDSTPEGQLKTAPVEVTVLYKGQPVQEAVVTFAGAQGSPPAFGRTDANGKAQMSTYGNGDGATLGSHMISVVKQEFANAKEAASQDSPDYVPPTGGGSPVPVVKDLLPKKFALPTTSGLTTNVVDGKNEVKLDLDK